MESETQPKRETWSRKIDFLMACIGFSVGLGNVWRFPYLCYKNGGGAFLVPYLLCVVIGGIPLYFLEVGVGHYMQKGGVYAWTFCPILQGIGFATTVTLFFGNCYYNVILAWAFYYLFASFNSELPWDSCDNYWNTDNCSVFLNQSQSSKVNGSENIQYIDATTEFWEYKVLNISSGVDDPVSIKWDLTLTLILSWCVVFVCIMNGIKSSGKVMYFTATAPYLFLLILLIRMSLLEGATDGILYYLVPDFAKLKDMQVWVDAGTQVFFSYAIALGSLTALGSYNAWGHNSYRDCLILACVNSGTSLFAGFVIFEVLGFMANQQQTAIGNVAESGPGLAFIAYPKAVSQMPASPIWAVLFFFMLILLGLDSEFVGVEGLITACVDTFPSIRLKKNGRTKFTAVMCFIQFAVGLSMVTNGGMYVFQLFDYYLGSRIILLVAFFMCIAVAWIYGVNRFYNNLEMVLGYRIGPYMKICWTFMSPSFCLSIFIMSGINYSELTYSRPTGVYTYPSWAIGVGWALAGVSGACIPLTALYKIVKCMCVDGKPFSSLFVPENLSKEQIQLEEEFKEKHKRVPDASEDDNIAYIS